MLETDKQGSIGLITLNNPPLNIISSGILQQLDEAFSRMEEDPDVIAIILTGKGDKAFVAGADIKGFSTMIGNVAVKQEAQELQKIFTKIASMAKPTVAVLNGVTFGGGLELAISCDIRIAEVHSKIGLPEVKLGIMPGWGGTQRLPRLIGEAKAKEMIFTGDAITAEEAQRIGLVNHVLPIGEGLEFALKLANKIGSHSLTALSRIKQSINEGLNTTIDEGIEIETQLFSELFLTEDVKEGLQAFLEKRPPSFSHK